MTKHFILFFTLRGGCSHKVEEEEDRKRKEMGLTRSLFMKRGSGFGDDSEEKQLQRKNNYGSDSLLDGGRALGEELVEEELRINNNNNNRNPVAKAMSSTIGVLATVGLFIYGFGMLYGNKGEAIFERWRMTSLSSP